jgi:hypothetical protein
VHEPATNIKFGVTHVPGLVTARSHESSERENRINEASKRGGGSKIVVDR